jgi:hypothetical protein
VGRWLLLVATLAYMAFFLVVVGSAAIAGGGEPDDALLVPQAVLFSLHIETMLLIGVLLVIYLRDAWRNPELEGDRRTFWAVVLFFGNVVAMPVYWRMYLRPGRPARTA